METITWATTPSNRTRKKHGVGEKDSLTLAGASGSQVTWSLSGPGTLSGTSGNPVTFTAHERASGASVTATYKGKTFSASFTVVEPSGVIIEQEQGTGIWHIQGIPSCGFKGRPYIQPDDVSFENIQIREGEVNAVCSGYFLYENGFPHPVGPWAPVGSVTAGKGSKVQGIDTIQGGSDNHIPYEDGLFTWTIPWYFKVGTGSEKQFENVDQVKTIDATGKLNISKDGTTKSAELNDPTSNY